jgi:hypothetical protein
MKYKFIVIFLSSSNLPESNAYFFRNQKYDFLKQHIPTYFVNYKKDIKFFFLEYKKDMVQDIFEENDYIYVKGEESVVPGVIKKLKKCVDYINKNYDYEYIVRTNLTTIFNLNRLLELYNNMPKTVFGGYYIFNSFFSGVAIFISKDLTEKIIISANENDRDNEDVLLTKTAKKNNVNLFMINNTNFHCKYLDILVTDNEINNEDNETLMYRITTPDNKTDINNFVALMKKNYRINL